MLGSGLGSVLVGHVLAARRVDTREHNTRVEGMFLRVTKYRKVLEHLTRY